MPELPEVETIRKQLEQELVGEIFAKVVINEAKVFLGEPQKLVGQRVEGIGRVGKYLFVRFVSGSGMVIHLKMTGRLILAKDKTDELDYGKATHTRIVTELESGRQLFYWDTRKFGYWQIVDDIAQVEEKTKKKLGPDPWEIDQVELLRKLQKTNRSIKDTLLDQSVLAGVGNIYANDALWLAGIDPRRKASKISLTEAKNLLTSLRTVLEKGLATGGASDNTYRDLYGERGGYQNEFLVYGKTKDKCLKCDRQLTYIHLGGRGTWFCENCQS